MSHREEPQEWQELGWGKLQGTWGMLLFPLFSSLHLAGGLPLSLSFFFSLWRLVVLAAQCKQLEEWQPPRASKLTSHQANHRRDRPSAFLCLDSTLPQTGPWLDQLGSGAFSWSGQTWPRSGVTMYKYYCRALIPVDSCTKVMSKWKTLQRKPRTWSEFPVILHCRSIFQIFYSHEANTFPTKLLIIPFGRPATPGIQVGEDLGSSLTVVFLQMDSVWHTSSIVSSIIET